MPKLSLDRSAPPALPGVLAVLTGEDVAKAGYQSPPPMVQYPGQRRHEAVFRPVLAQGRVRHVGEEVALVVAETWRSARRRRSNRGRLLRPSRRDRGGRCDRDGAPLLDQSVPGNVAFDL